MRIAQCAIALGLLSFAAATTHAYEDEDYRDKKFAAGKEDKDSNSYFKLDGVIWGAYEHNDHRASGAADAAGPADEKTGFKVGRAYINARGGADRGSWKGWSYRATLDLAPAGTLGDGCGPDNLCQRNNDYQVIMKYAYVDMPVYGGVFARLGQQGTPVVGGTGSGSDSQDLWDHRYLDLDGKAMWDELALSSSSDRGVSLFYKNDYFGIHLLLANGESYHRNNAETVATSNDTLAELSAGAGDSYGQDLYAQLAYRPLGKNREHQIHLMLPFRQHNVFGIDDSEVEFAAADLSVPTAPRWTYLKGDKRSKRDQAYGVEAVYVREWSYMHNFSIGAGAAGKVDKRGEARRYTQSAADLTLADTSCTTGRICVDEDRRGHATYAYAHVRWGLFGAFFRVSGGDGSTTRLSDRLEPSAGGDYWRKVLKKDAEDGVLGNLKLSEGRALDFGLARFRKGVIGVTWHPHQRFRLSLGVSRITASDVEGRTRRENGLERVHAQTPSTTNLSAQTERLLVAQQPGFDGVTTNDLIGRPSEDRQVFVRAQYSF